MMNVYINGAVKLFVVICFAVAYFKAFRAKDRGDFKEMIFDLFIVLILTIYWVNM